MTNFARFTIDGDASTNRGYDVLNGAAATIALETPTSEQWKVTYSVSDATDENAPMASKAAPELVLDNGAGSTGTSVTAATPAGGVTTTWPASGDHSYIVRCTVNNGVNPDGSVNSDYVFERMVSIRSLAGLRKIVPGEGTQYSARGWADAQNESVDSIPAQVTGTAYQFLTWDTDAWVATTNLILATGEGRSISVADNTTGDDMIYTAGAGTAGNGGAACLQGASASIGDDDGAAMMRQADGTSVFQVGGNTGAATCGWFGSVGTTKQTVNYSAGDSTALKNLLIALNAHGLIAAAEV